jgi:hypothetical protein
MKSGPAQGVMQMPPTQSQYFPLVGGLDVESAQLSRKPGLVMAGLNYESATENGYERIGGSERFDGRARPSDAEFSVLQAAAAFTGVSVGNTVVGASSGATAKVIALRGSTQLVTTRQAGTFTAGEDITVAAVVKGVYSTIGSDLSSADDNTYSALAATDYRASIAAVPGSGALRGIKWLGSTCYAFRDNVGATALAIYKSSGTGWTLVPLFEEMSFTAGSGTPPAEGAVITQGAVTATVKRVVLQSGTWAGGTAAGRFIVTSVVGGPFIAGAFTAGVTATVSAANTQIALLPGGRLEMVTYNFTGSTDTERIYGADGVNRGFEFDGVVLVPIVTGMTADTPRHVYCHKKHLFFSFRASVQHSGIGTPYAWSAVLGAAEIATGQDVTGFLSAPGNADTAALLIFSEARTQVLYGSSSSDWKLDTFSDQTGARRWSVQNLGVPVVMDAQGVAVVAQAQEFGNFARSEVSSRIRRYLQGRTVTASVVNRAKGRMRIFFSDGDALSITAVGKGLAFMPINYGAAVSCTCEALVSGVHRNFFGGADGYVYEADRGRSFDGAEITAWVKLAFNFAKSPGLKKRFRKADIEVKPQSACTLAVQGEYSLGDVDVSLTDVYSKDIRGLGGAYDVDNWDECYYDSASQSSTNVRLDGVGTSLSLTVLSESAVELPHELQSVTTFFTPRRLERG